MAGDEQRSAAPVAGPVGGGTTVRLRGPGLAGARRVLFGDTAGTQLRQQVDGSISVVTPGVASPREVVIAVVVRDGAVRSWSRFAYVAPPRVDALMPASGPAAGGTWVVLTGAFLSGATAVRFDYTAAVQVVADSPTQVRALSPQHPAGPVNVSVITPGGTSAPVRFVFRS